MDKLSTDKGNELYMCTKHLLQDFSEDDYARLWISNKIYVLYFWPECVAALLNLDCACDYELWMLPSGVVFY